MTTKTTSPSLLVKNFEEAGNLLAEFGKQFVAIRSCDPYAQYISPYLGSTERTTDATFRYVLKKTNQYSAAVMPVLKSLRFHFNYAHDYVRYAYVKISDPVVEQQLQEVEAHYAQMVSISEQFHDVINEIFEELTEQQRFLAKVSLSSIGCDIATCKLNNVLQLSEEQIENIYVKLFSAMSTFVGLWQEKIADRISEVKAQEYRLGSLKFEELDGSKIYKEPTVEEKRGKHRHNML